LSEDKVGGLALLRNLRNIEEAKVEPAVVRAALGRLRGRYLLPLNFWAAWKAAPRWAAEIEDAMLRTYETLPKLPGVTAFVLDGSGSMSSRLSAKSDLTRFDAGVALMTLAASQAETAVPVADHARRELDHSSGDPPMRQEVAGQNEEWDGHDLELLDSGEQLQGNRLERYVGKHEEKAEHRQTERNRNRHAGVSPEIMESGARMLPDLEGLRELLRGANRGEILGARETVRRLR
jgi:hypothetical protein